jgi:hypothetical protein
MTPPTTWINATDEFTVENKTGYQRFELSLGIDARSIRMICTTNQTSRFLGQNNEVAGDDNNNNNNNNNNQFHAVGFYSIKFE